MSEEVCGTCHKEKSQCQCIKNGVGTKADDGKKRWDLLMWREVEQVVDVLTHGSKKYQDNNWQKVPEGRKRYFAAAMRHIMKRVVQNEIIDKDSGAPHLSCAICDLLFFLWFDNEELGDKK